MDREGQEARRQVILRLGQVLASREMSHSELARRLGQAHSAISDWFNKRALPSGDALVRMFQLPEFRHVSAEWLLTGEGSQLKTTSLPAQQAYNLGGIASLTQAADECERLKQLWLTAQQGTEKKPATSAGAARAAEASEAVRKAKSRVRKRA